MRLEKKPWVVLLPENMTEDLIGLQVTLFNESTAVASELMWIRGYDDTNLHLSANMTSGKIVKTPYNPQLVMLRVYQFDLGIEFSEEEKPSPQPKPIVINEEK